MTGQIGIYLEEPWWLVVLVLIVPVVWPCWRWLAPLGVRRRALAVICRCVLVMLLAVMLARPMSTEKDESLTLVTVLDRSLSIPPEIREGAVEYLKTALANRDGESKDELAVIDTAERASIAQLPGMETDILMRNTSLAGSHSDLAVGVQMGITILPPNRAARMLLVSDGNETEGDLLEAARIAAVNNIPIDVLPVFYAYEKEVLFRRLAAPAHASSGQTVPLRFILDSMSEARGQLYLNLNGKPVDLDPESPAVGVATVLKEGTNVKTVSLPVGTGGVHKFEARFVPDGSGNDAIAQNNQATATTIVRGPGHVMVVEGGDGSAELLAKSLSAMGIDVVYRGAALFPDELSELMSTDGIVLVNVSNSRFTFAQQEMLKRYVEDLGGGLVIIGGDQSFGAGGWIGSPLAEVVPVDMDPPQKKQMPKGALMLVIDRSGSMTGEKLRMCKLAASASIRALSRLDSVGVVVFDSEPHWVVEMQRAGDKDSIVNDVGRIRSGGGTVMAPALEEAMQALQETDAAVRHVIVLTDGQTAGDDPREVTQRMAAAGISVSAVGVGDTAAGQLLVDMAKIGNGRAYYVQDPRKLPQIFIKEAQVVRRALINEETFAPKVAYSLSEILKGFGDELPVLDGYVLTGAKGGLTQMVLTTATDEPLLATGQAGLGRCAAFTSSIDSRWASHWIGWSGFERFWEQVVRWAAKSGEAADCEVMTDINGQEVSVHVEAVDAEGEFIQLTHIDGQVIGPDMTAKPLSLQQVGPGQFRGRFDAEAAGSYVVTLRYRKAGEEELKVMQSTVAMPFAPEYLDLRDNAGLLRQVCEITGGRLLSGDPEGVDLFDRAGVMMPETRTPLTTVLIMMWIGVFLLDVGVRRLSLDWQAIGQRMAAPFRRKRKGGRAEVHLEQLRRKRQAVRKEMDTKAAPTEAAAASTLAREVAKRRYTAGETVEAAMPEAPEMSVRKPAKEPEKTSEDKPKDEAKAESHIDALLKARKRREE